MNHATLPHPALAVPNGSPRQQAREPSPPAALRGLVMSDQEGFFSSLPRHVTRGVSQPPAWWLDERAKVVASAAGLPA